MLSASLNKTFLSLSHFIIICAVYVPRHAEIAYFDDHALGDQTVPGGQVPVHEMLGRQVVHAHGYVVADLQQLRERQQLPSLGHATHQARVRAVRPEIETSAVVLLKSEEENTKKKKRLRN